eukprot:COSAG06_NODE_4292_length_4393_cov_5.143811_2_plen_81_part_00
MRQALDEVCPGRWKVAAGRAGKCAACVASDRLDAAKAATVLLCSSLTLRQHYLRTQPPHEMHSRRRSWPNAAAASVGSAK